MMQQWILGDVCFFPPLLQISSLMGFTWLFGFAAVFSDVMALLYLFIVLNSCQGLLIFVSFVCNRKAGRLWLGLLCGRRRQRGRGSGGGKTGNRDTPACKAMLRAPCI